MNRHFVPPIRALKTVDELVQKLEFEGPSISITSRHLAVGVSALNTTVFNGTSFSAFMAPNGTEPQVPVFHLKESDPSWIWICLSFTSSSFRSISSRTG